MSFIIIAYLIKGAFALTKEKIKVKREKSMPKKKHSGELCLLIVEAAKASSTIFSNSGLYLGYAVSILLIYAA